MLRKDFYFPQKKSTKYMKKITQNIRRITIYIIYIVVQFLYDGTVEGIIVTVLSLVFARKLIC